MSDYISTLTGAQMDAALLDMAEHNSEAYAVGERNGIDVPPDDVTYHNNARYYAQQAQSIAPASVTEAVRWDIAQTALTDANKEQARENINAADNDTAVQVVAQTFTSAQQEIARTNIGAGGTNPNLLDNGWFTVNQREVANGTAITGNGYFADRWQATGSGGVTRNADGTITITSTAFHKFGDRGLSGKTVTFSALFVDGTVEYDTVVFSGTPLLSIPSLASARLYGSANQINIGGSSKDVRAVKLELGSVSTLANDATPDYGTELLKCMRYANILAFPTYGSIGIAYATSTTAANIILSLSVPMRTLPSLTYSGSLRLYDPANNGSISVTNLTMGASANTPVGNTLLLGITASGLTAGKYYVLSGAGTAGKISLSADL